jgi:hypothetical protein
VPIPRRGDDRASASHFVAAEDAAQLANAVGPLLERAVGVQWYETIGNDADVATVALCRLRRAKAGLAGGAQQGDAAVREALGEVSPAALVWIASRAISYMDEIGFPETVEPWFAGEEHGF